MNIAVIHLSDLHIASKDPIHMKHINALVKSLQVISSFEGVIVAFSGDIAAKGFRTEYELASKFIGSVCKEIIEKYNIPQENIKVLVVPGNHDMNRTVYKKYERATCHKWYEDKTIDAQLENELNCMNDFFNFAKKFHCFLGESKFLSRKILPFTKLNGEKEYLETNLINSAIFSCNDDNGLHYLPETFIEQYENNKYKTKFSMSIMHHSPDWFSVKQKNKLRKMLYSNSQLVLCGHEHNENTQGIEMVDELKSVLQCSGAWWKDNFNNSSYFIGNLNLETGIYAQYEFTWNNRTSMYDHSNKKEFSLQRRNEFTGELSPKGEYIEKIISDEKYPICQDFRKYFVFPDIKMEKSDDYKETTDIASMEELIKLILENQELMILGGSGSGKTTLARMLFLELCKEYTVLLCDVSDIAGKMQKNIIQNVFNDIYDKDNFNFFEQQDKSKKIVIIDGFDTIKPDHLSKFLPDLAYKFSHIILIGERHKVDDFDMRMRLKEELKQEKIKEVKIGKFFADKRIELVRKVIDVSIEEDGLKNRLEIQIEKALSLQGLEYKLDPDFIVNFSNYYSQNIKDLHFSNTNVFSKVFEASIEVAIRLNLNKETVGQVRTALSEVAYYIHFNKAYPIRESDIENIVKDYCEKYDETLSPVRFLDIITKAKLLIRGNESLSYKFKNKDHLAYFVAEALMRKFNAGDKNAEENLNEVIKYSCFSINPTILKFITYASGNIRIVELLLQQAKHFVEEWNAYDVENNEFKYLSTVQESTKYNLSESKESEIKAKANREKIVEEIESSQIEVLDIYDFDIEDINKISNQFMTAYLQMNSISGCLVTFGHILPAELKNELVEAMYTMPNQFFYKWASIIDENIDGYIKEFMEEDIDGEISANEKTQKILATMQNISTATLTNLYYAVAVNGATLSTIGILKRDKHIANHNNELERLMFLEQTDEWSEFIDKASELYSKTKSGMVKTIIQSMVKHLLIWSPTLPRAKRDHLIDVYKLSASKKTILLQANQKKS